MPRAKLETAFIGRYTLAALDAAPDAAFLWLGRALFAWILRDELPNEIPPEHLTAWTMIREESATIHEARKQFAEAGAKGGKANASERKRKEANASERKRTDSKNKSKIEIENTSADAEETRESTPRACEDFPDCPIPADRLRVLAAHIGMDEAELSAWRDFYTAQEWRFKPVSPRPMTQAAAEASLRNWHTMRGVREAREAHLDAKADERAAKRTAALQGPAPTSYAALEAAKRRAEAESPCVVGFDENGLAILGKKGAQP